MRAGESEVSVQLNKDFDNARMTPEECAKLTLSWQAGGMSWKTLYYNLEQGELTRPGIDADQERLDIESERIDFAPLDPTTQNGPAQKGAGAT
ncbi:MAG: hypothetical protein ABSH28_24015 [Acidobacteriota bacterium]|jgi:hypothetical protein